MEKHRYVVDTGEAILLPRPTILLCPHQLRKCQQTALEKNGGGMSYEVEIHGKMANFMAAKKGSEVAAYFYGQLTCNAKSRVLYEMHFHRHNKSALFIFNFMGLASKVTYEGCHDPN